MGRLDNADLPYTTRHPALLYKQHHLTFLITQDAHDRVKHNGVKETLIEIRSKYWIVKGRQFVRKVIHKCTVCHKFEGLPQPAPPPPPLPEFRVKEPAFMYTGVDFAGPRLMGWFQALRFGYVCTPTVLSELSIWTLFLI